MHETVLGSQISLLPSREREKVKKPASRRPGTPKNSDKPGFLFATGIENSSPTIDGGKTRIDISNEHRVYSDGRTDPSGEVFGYDEITRQYYRRYQLPVMHTETNLAQGDNGDEAVCWLWKEWANVLCVRNEGVPISDELEMNKVATQEG